MLEVEVVRYMVRPHRPFGNEEYDPGNDMLVIVHKNPDDPDDPTEFGHHIHLSGLSYRKEMWGLDEYADVIDRELQDLERFYAWDAETHKNVHPLAGITEHYFVAPRQRMENFTPDYVLDKFPPGQVVSPTGKRRLATDAVLMGLDDVRACLATKSAKRFPCEGMTNLSADSVAKRNTANDRMAAETKKVKLKSTKELDNVRQLLTDRTSELETVRQGFVNHILMQASVPDLMLKKVEAAIDRRNGRGVGA